LTIVKKLITLLGQIKLKKYYWQGSEFSFDLLFRVNENKQSIKESQIEYDFSLLENKKVLIVEDNKSPNDYQTHARE
jgi:hypothetical protein